MRRLRLTTLLIGSNVGLLLLAVVGVSFIAVRLLQHLADDQALARVAQAGAIAQQETLRAGDDLAMTARLLGERPTLRRLLETDDTAALTMFLSQFQQTSQLDGSAVMDGDQVIVRTGAAIPWSALWTARNQAGSHTLFAQAGVGPILLTAWDSVSGLPGKSVMVVRSLDAAFAQQVSADIGVPITILLVEKPLPLGPRLHQREENRACGARRSPSGAYHHPRVLR